MKVEDFDFYLPQEFIAQEPAEPRDASRMLVLSRKDGTLEHRLFKDIVLYLRKGDVLVFNDTRVIPARLFGILEKKGLTVEVLLLKQRMPDVWEVLVSPGKKVRKGELLEFGEGQLCATVQGYTEEGGRLLKFHYSGDFKELLGSLGKMPLPPYIKKYPKDPAQYQTVYAKHEGSVAAPTAGFHFTESLMKKIEEKGVSLVFVLLHVGLGTFRPVRTLEVENHRMHAEYYSVDADAASVINEARSRGGRVIAVGTTVTRVLETVSDEKGTIHPGSGWTEIFIYPGYRFKAIDGLITNFHLPRSTLLMLVSAFAGREKILDAYKAAVQQKYRFFSFGDAMLIL